MAFRDPRSLIVASIALLFALAHAPPSRAQNVLGILAPGNAAVTGFSGAAWPLRIPPGVIPASRATIDLNGASVRIIDLQNMGGPQDARLVPARAPFSITAGQVGQVFGVTLDNAVPPNIYVAASSAYGLHIVGPSPTGEMLHTRTVRPGVAFMPGMWGQGASNGGPGSIWKIDGITGATTLFTNVILNGAANSGPALGNLAYDPDTNTLFAADRETGLIHRYAMNGAEVGRYDHGVEGRTAAGLAPVTFDPAKRLVITAPPFNPDRPDTWNYAAPERRPFALAVHRGRLFYSIAEGQQVWSVAISRDRVTEPTFELTVPPGNAPSEISKITFDDQGRMLLAERADPTGAWDFRILAQEGAGRVLRYSIIDDYPGLPRTWQPVPNEYAIGFNRTLQNGNGGISIGYEYDRLGRADAGSCGGYLWSTGEALRRSGNNATSAQLQRNGRPDIDGLQGNPLWMVREFNVPPLQSYFIDYDSKLEPDDRGHLGDLAIWRVCGPVLRGGWMLPTWFIWWDGTPGTNMGAPPPALACPADQKKPGFQCCPAGSSPGPNGQCKPFCPNGANDPKSVKMCSLGFDAATYDPNNLSKLTCIGGGKPAANKGVMGCVEKSPTLGAQVCMAGWSKQNVPNMGNVCAPTKAQLQCPAGQQLGTDNKCHALCLGGMAWPSTQCCAAGAAVTPTGQCCPLGSTVDAKTGKCTKTIVFCLGGGKFDPATGKCAAPSSPPTPGTPSGPPLTQCADGSSPDPVSGGCSKTVSACPPGTSADPVTGECKKGGPPVTCKVGWSSNPAGGCCPPGQAAGPNGQCKMTSCAAPSKQVGGRCCSPDDLKVGGACAANVCGAGKAPAGASGACCPSNQLYNGASGQQLCCAKPLVNGQCQPLSGNPLDPKCAPGSTDPACCAKGFQWAGGSCCQQSQVTSTGVCCPAGQSPTGPKKDQCTPTYTGNQPPYGDTPPGTNKQCCMAGSTLTVGGSCCAITQITSGGMCCPAGQVPDPKNRKVCIVQKLQGTPVLPTCPQGQSKDSEGVCCPNANLKGGRCVQGGNQKPLSNPVPPPVSVQPTPVPIRPNAVQPVPPPPPAIRPNNVRPAPPQPVRPNNVQPPRPTQVRPNVVPPRPPAIRQPQQQFRAPPARPQCTVVNGRTICR
jgi:hypothetical protein